MRTIVVTGDREWVSLETIERALRWAADQLGVTLSEISVVEGEAQGADLGCRVVAEALGMTVVPVPADWKLFGRAAGPIRNQQMLDEHTDITLCLAFHDNLAASKGTKDMVKRTLKKSIPVYHWTSSSTSPTRLS